ncbi:hypothetical protein PC129_g14392 [Phytophthora cactorum]|uniref:Uncharacterized protein n=1 Tax=Phytophthora cactorum TaxID=29920 RepID=A0A329RQE8_9STRA|nr:hypothetical protein PC111_g21088 [Phytophthora cactorum]KAG2820416.1 hypothetical protein PC112_g11786 [Phytophthora cactorum]KAG2837593.1 hypothetical protein PC113_g19809 [Phytophthora cactorum]KAG2884799.1 hypothetical protein PC115_g21217 [Phytophthora cactorum]KAG2893833.1 hypothetical protein PC117_g23667 [Phytophthora cactorum]
MDRAPPALLQDVYRDQLVAFTPEKEQWMKSKVYKGVGTVYIIGRVCRRPKKGRYASLFQIQ